MNTVTPEHSGLPGTSGAPFGTPPTVESAASAVSWPAIFAGAVVAASVSLLLVALGSGLGLASVSPWPGNGASATTFTVMTAIWLIVVQWVASGAGGYLAGRLRTKWVGTHTHEVFFKDTAHGFATWGTATVIVAGFLASAASSLAGAGARATATVAAGASQGALQGAANSPQALSSVDPYDLDVLFRSPRPDQTSTPADARAETARILAQGATSGDVPTADRSYLAELVAQHTGVTPDDAQRRVDTAIVQTYFDWRFGIHPA